MRTMGALLVGLLLASASGGAQDDNAPRRKENFERLRDELLLITDANLRKGAMLVVRSSAPVVMSALEPESAAASTERLALGVRTNVEGAEAGVVVAPFALKDPGGRLAGLSFTLAALKDDKVRMGVGI